MSINRNRVWKKLTATFSRNRSVRAIVLILILSSSPAFASENALPPENGIILPDNEKIERVKNGECNEAVASIWGFDPDDATDSLQAALDSGVTKLIVDKQAVPWTVRPLEINVDGLEIVLERGVEIVAKKGEYQGRSDSLLSINRKSDVAIRGNGGVLRMRKADYHQAPYQPSEWRHAVNLIGAKNIVLEDLIIIESGGDGVYVGASYLGPCENIVVRKVVVDGNNRQGMSVISVKGLHVSYSVFKNTKGTNPQAGLDVEPNNPSDVLQDVVFKNCVFEKNAAEGISFYLAQLNDESEPIDATFDGCVTRFNDSCAFSFVMPSGANRFQGNVTVKNSLFNGDFNGILIRSKVASGGLLRFENVKIVNAASRDSDERRAERAPITISSGVRDSLPAGGLRFQNVELVDSIERDELVYRDSSRIGLGVADIQGEIALKRSVDGDVVERLILDDSFFAEKFPQTNPDRVPLLETRQNAFAPLNETNGNPFPFIPEQANGIRARNQGDFRLYAEQGKTIKFTLQEFPYAQIAQAPVVPEWTTPDGETTKLEPIEFLGTRSYEIEAQETGVYKLWFDINPHNVQFSECNVPFVFWAEPYAMSMEYAATFYFYVPEGTETFGMKFDDGTYSATVTDPDGDVVWQGDRLPSIFFPPKEIKSGVWSVRFDRVGDKPQGTVCFNLLGIPSYLATERGAVFVPREKESRD